MGNISLESVFEAYYECRQHKRRTANATLFELDYESKLVDLWRDINNRTYEIGKSICFAITRPKIREVFAVDFRDRVVHHIVIQRLEPLFENVFIEDNYNCRKGKGVLFGVNRLHEKMRIVSENYTKDCWIGKFDMAGFFMSIDKNILWHKLQDFILENYKEQDQDLILWLIKMIVFNDPQKNCVIKGNIELLKKLPKNKSLFTCGEGKGLPIGNLTSQIFANFYLHEFDREMQDRYKNYGRYVDDFYVLAYDKKTVLEARRFAEKYLKDNVLVELSEKKVYVQPYWHGVMFIGTMLKLGRKYIGNRTVHNVLQAIKKFDDLDSVICSLNSYFGFMKHCNSYHIRRTVGRAVPKELLQKIYITGKCLIVKKKRLCTQKTTKSTLTQVNTSLVAKESVTPSQKELRT